VLKTLESPLDCKIKPVNLKGNQPWIFIGRNEADTETAILWPPDAKSQVIGKGLDNGKDWRQEEKGMVLYFHFLLCILRKVGINNNSLTAKYLQNVKWCGRAGHHCRNQGWIKHQSCQCGPEIWEAQSFLQGSLVPISANGNSTM